MANIKKALATVLTFLVAVGAPAAASTSCASKRSYTALPDVVLSSPGAGVDDSSSITSGMRPTAEKAAEFCRYEPRCTSWDSRGSYTVGPILGDPSPAPGVCSYVKDACPPQPGFDAHPEADVDTSVLPARERLSGNCLNDVYKTCLADSNCVAFNRMRYVWAASHTPADIAAQLTYMPGSCVYVKKTSSPPPPTASPPRPPPPSASGCSDVSAALIKHNEFRALHGVPALSWNESLAAEAQVWANTHVSASGCTMVHSSDHWYGENLYWSGSTLPFSAADAKCASAAIKWYDEIVDYKWTGSPWKDNSATFSKVGHFTQVVWKSSTAVGCGAARGGGPAASGGWYCYLVVCRYMPPGNVATDDHLKNNVMPLKAHSN